LQDVLLVLGVLADDVYTSGCPFCGRLRKHDEACKLQAQVRAIVLVLGGELLT